MKKLNIIKIIKRNCGSRQFSTCLDSRWSSLVLPSKLNQIFEASVENLKSSCRYLSLQPEAVQMPCRGASFLERHGSLKTAKNVQGNYETCDKLAVPSVVYRRVMVECAPPPSGPIAMQVLPLLVMAHTVSDKHSLWRSCIKLLISESSASLLLTRLCFIPNTSRYSWISRPTYMSNFAFPLLFWLMIESQWPKLKK